jgi:uncharacterized protein (DUF2225 family)
MSKVCPECGFDDFEVDISAWVLVRIEDNGFMNQMDGPSFGDLGDELNCLNCGYSLSASETITEKEWEEKEEREKAVELLKDIKNT